MKVVCKALPFQMICDWGTKELPFTIRGVDSAPPGIVFGESEVIWGWGTDPGQLLKTKSALQVDQPDSSVVRAARQVIRSRKGGPQGLARPDCILAPFRAPILYPRMVKDCGLRPICPGRVPGVTVCFPLSIF